MSTEETTITIPKREIEDLTYALRVVTELLTKRMKTKPPSQQEKFRMNFAMKLIQSITCVNN